MPVRTSGLHHITAIVVDPQANIDFYTSFLGLRLVKATVNYDSPDTYHFYYGDHVGHPGSVLTFFPFVYAAAGRPGAGMADMAAFAIPSSSVDFWMQRLTERGIDFDGPRERFGHTVLGFSDPDGLHIELEASDEPAGSLQPDTAFVAEPEAVRGFSGVALRIDAPDRTIRLLTDTFGYRLAEESHDRARFVLDGAAPGRRLDILCRPEAPEMRPGGGTIHHIAFRVPTVNELLAAREELVGLGYNVTPVRERYYFQSIYFREPGGVLFEIATEQPGFTTDEPLARLGSALKLPPWLETHRTDVERRLPPVRLPGAAR